MAIIESKPNLDGRNMIMMLAPIKQSTSKADGENTRKAAESSAEPQIADVPAEPSENDAPVSE